MTVTTPTVPDISWFRDPHFTEPTPLTVTPDGRVFGHLCEFDRAHIGFSGRQVLPPRGDDMRFFLTGATDVLDDDGNVTEISVGKLTMNTGHAGVENHVSAAAAARHYDDTGTIAALVNAGSDSIGIWMAGAMMPDLDAFTTRRFRSCGASGDWRYIEGSLRLVAALSVPVGGFPIPRARVASGAPLALVAAGMVAAPAAFGRRVDPAWTRPRPAGDTFTVNGVDLASHAVAVGKLATGAIGARVEVHANGEIRFYRADDSDVTVTRDDVGDLTAEQAALLDAIDDSPALVASLLDELDETPQQVAALLAALEDEEVGDFNWVDDVGGLPKYIKRISKHLRAKGMTESHAIATAVNAAKKMCSTGDLNFPGAQQVNPGSRAEACAAIADWEAKKARARAS